MDDEWDPLACDDMPDDDEPVGVPAPAAPAATASAGEEGAAAQIGLTDKNCRVIVKQVLQEVNCLDPRLWMDLEHAGLPDLSLGAATCTVDNWTHTDVLLTLGAGIAYITLNRPNEKNMINDGLAAGLRDAVQLLHTRRDIRVVVLSGKGKFFCAGDDPARLSTLIESETIPLWPGANQEAVEALADRARHSGLFPGGRGVGLVAESKCLWNLATLPQVTVGVATGSAIGAGVGLLCCCDIVIGVNGVFLNFDELQRGLISGVATPYVMQKIGSRHVKEMMCRGLNISAEKAVALGAFDHVVSTPQDVQQVLAEVCRDITDAAPEAVTETKRIIAAVSGMPVSGVLMDYTVMKHSAVLQGGEFAAKAKAPWKTSTVVPLVPPPWV
eukprot:NODE_6956_length_1621_cov_15.933066.p1 GENE.NODE_6956_length_1621_cov_15.933066~~NODE_6956_length_1621_cov_15.933066.p1  ORF type:complete len:385 (+),score=119.27 NODE_6956_length_1621_cov_15.933066:114-1268(+)